MVCFATVLDTDLNMPSLNALRPDLNSYLFSTREPKAILDLHKQHNSFRGVPTSN
jgi:hypothetical protein